MNTNIESILNEHRVFTPSATFSGQAHVKSMEDYEAIYQKSVADPESWWAQQAGHLHWQQPWNQILDWSNPPFAQWFLGGKINVSENCLDRHVTAGKGDRIALRWEGEPGDRRDISYSQLLEMVCRAANALKVHGVQAGDRVLIYMPMIPEAAAAMLACARIGAVHSVVFGGFSATAIKDRLEDSKATAIITADGGWRRGNVVPLKANVDEALTHYDGIHTVLVVKRCGNEVTMTEGRDRWWDEECAAVSADCPAEGFDSEHPLYILYTSGSTGKPKGILHTSGGYLTGAATTFRYIFDHRDSDVFWCTADVGWVTGHSYVAYGPLAAGATLVMYEGAPTFPDGGRFWQTCERHGVTIFYTAPTAIRALMKLGEAIPQQYDLSKIRLLGTVGEPINPEAWIWYHRVIGRERCPVVDTWWQTETGAIMISPLPGTTATKPGSCTRPLPGIEVDIVDDDGVSVTQPDAGGYLVVKKPWPSMLRTIWGDNDRYLSTYWEKFQNRFYVAGDSAHRDADGYFWIMGRIDDVLNVAGHRLGTMEIESALVAHPKVAEAAVVGRQHDIKGEAVFAYVVLNGARPAGADAVALTDELRRWVAEQLGAIAKPDTIRFADNLPKTRSGKIMRRLLRSIARDEPISQDLSTLENPAIIEQLKGESQGGA